MENLRETFGLNAFQLKLIAIITMIIDHVGFALFPQQVMFRVIGRLAFPIFCFLLVEGFYHTKDIKKYMTRLLVFALISEVPFDLFLSGEVIDLSHQNIFFTLLLGVGVLYILNLEVGNFHKLIGVYMVGNVTLLLRPDYDIRGLLMILFFYIFREKLILTTLSISVLSRFMGVIQAYASFAIIPIALYNGKQGPKMKYVFYAFYPVHLLIIVWIRDWVMSY